MNKKKIFLSTLILLGIFIISAIALERYIWVMDCIVIGAVFSGIYYIYDKLNLTSFLFVLISILVIMHCSAVYGWFKMSFFGYEYDAYVHTYSSIILAVIAFNYVKKFNQNLAETVFLAMFITLGVGLFNELVEFAGYKLMGKGEGLFLLGPGDIGATNAFENLMTDLFQDFYGNLAGLFLAVVYTLKTK